MTYWKKNDFERVVGGALIRNGSWSNAKRESKIYIMNSTGNEECAMEYEEGNI